MNYDISDRMVRVIQSHSPGWDECWGALAGVLLDDGRNGPLARACRNAPAWRFFEKFRPNPAISMYDDPSEEIGPCDDFIQEQMMFLDEQARKGTILAGFDGDDAAENAGAGERSLADAAIRYLCRAGNIRTAADSFVLIELCRRCHIADRVRAFLSEEVMGSENGSCQCGHCNGQHEHEHGEDGHSHHVCCDHDHDEHPDDRPAASEVRRPKAGKSGVHWINSVSEHADFGENDTEEDNGDGEYGHHHESPVDLEQETDFDEDDATDDAVRFSERMPKELSDMFCSPLRAENEEAFRLLVESPVSDRLMAGMQLFFRLDRSRPLMRELGEMVEAEVARRLGTDDPKVAIAAIHTEGLRGRAEAFDTSLSENLQLRDEFGSGESMVSAGTELAAACFAMLLVPLSQKQLASLFPEMDAEGIRESIDRYRRNVTGFYGYAERCNEKACCCHSENAGAATTNHQETEVVLRLLSEIA